MNSKKSNRSTFGSTADSSKCDKPIKPTHEVVYYTQSRIVEAVQVDPESGLILAAGPMLQLFKGLTLQDIRHRKQVTSIREVAPPAPSTITITDVDD